MDQSVNGLASFANQILSSVDPQASFNKIIDSSQDAKNAWEIIQKYGNGDPKVAFQNYAAEKGKQSFAQQILAKLGLS